ncbi:MAG: hypothetical protein PHD67_02660 [Oscillospiraceae bacterium]|nr:hypothetical protein [Oscillospiraceae bacterium]
MKQSTKRLLALLFALILTLGLTGCAGGNKKNIVGTWELADDAGSTYGFGVRFEKDGSFFFSGSSDAESEEELQEAFEAMEMLYSISYKVKSDTELEITQKIFGGLGGKEVTVVSYSLDGDVLILDGATYHRAS